MQVGKKGKPPFPTCNFALIEFPRRYSNYESDFLRRPDDRFTDSVALELVTALPVVPVTLFFELDVSTAGVNVRPCCSAADAAAYARVGSGFKNPSHR